MTAPAPHDVLYVTDGFMYWLSDGMMSGGRMFKQAVENGTRTQFMSGGILSIVSDPNSLYGISGKEILRVSK